MKHLHALPNTLISWAVLLLMVWVPMATAQEIPLTASGDLARMVAEGLENNQKLQSQRSKIAALREEIPAAGALDDPTLGLAFLNLPTDTFRFDQEPMTQKQISLAQKFPWFGKLDLKTQVAVLEAKKAEARLSGQQLALSRNIVAAYYEWALIVRSEKTNTQLMEKLNNLLQVSESRYAGGKGTQADLLQIQLELSRLAEEQNDLADKRQIMESRLNELLNRPSFAKIPPAEELPLPVVALAPEQIKQRALTRNPDMAFNRLSVEQAQIMVKLSNKEFYPNFDVRVAYGQREDDRMGTERADFFSAGVNLNIPLWQTRKQRPRLDGAIKRKQSEEHMLRDLQHSLPHKIDALLSETERLRKNHRLYTETLLFQAEQWADSAQAAYEVGKMEFDTLIKAQMQVLRLSLKADTHLFRLYQKRAELEELAGGVISK